MDLGGIKSPCMDCKERELHCHSHCEKYQDFKSKGKRNFEARFGYFIRHTWTAARRSTFDKWMKERDNWWKK